MDQFGRPDINDAGPAPEKDTPANRSVPVGAVRSGDMGAEAQFSNKRGPEDDRDGYWIGFDPIDHVLKFVLGGGLSRLMYKLGGFRWDLKEDSRAGNAIFIQDERKGNLPSVDIRRTNGQGGALNLQSDAGSALQARQTDDTSTERIVGEAVKAGHGGVSEAIAESGATGPVRLNRAQGLGTASYDNIENAASQSPTRIAATIAVVSSHFWRVDRFIGGAPQEMVNVQVWISDGTTPHGNLTGHVGDLCLAGMGETYQCDGNGATGPIGTIWHAVGQKWGATIDSDQSATLWGFTATIKSGAPSGTTGFRVVKEDSGNPQSPNFGFDVDMGSDASFCAFRAVGVGGNGNDETGKHFVAWEKSAATNTKLYSAGNGAASFAEWFYIRSDGALCFTNGDAGAQKMVALKPPSAAIAADVEWEMPSADGADDDCLVRLTGGKLSFAARAHAGDNLDIESLQNCHLYYVTNIDGSNTGQIRWYELVANGTNYFALQAPANLGSNNVQVLPSSGAGRRGESLMQYSSTLAGDSANQLQFGPGHYVFYPTEASPTDVDWLKGDVAYLELTGDHAINFPTAGAEGAKYQIIIKQGAGGSHLVSSWPTIKWRGGSAPTLTTTAGHYDIITLLYANSTYFGDVSKDHS